MPLILPKSCFHMIPRTGTTWVRQAIIESMGKGNGKLPYYETGDKHAVIENPAGKLGFCFVREIPAWLESRHRLGKWNDMLSPFWDVDFNKFKANLAERPKGIIGRYFKKYTDQCGFVGRTENLAEDLIKVLALAGEKFDPDIIRELPPCNVGHVADELMPVPEV